MSGQQCCILVFLVTRQEKLQNWGAILSFQIQSFIYTVAMIALFAVIHYSCYRSLVILVML